MELVGKIFVDAGCVLVGDPCYTLPDEGSHRDDSVRDWSQFVRRMFDEKGNRINEVAPGVCAPFQGGAETGLVVESGYGDGEYPVYVERTRDGRVGRLIVVFDGDDEESDYVW